MTPRFLPRAGYDAYVVVRDVVRTDASVLAGLAELGVSTVHEADHRRGALDPTIRPIQAGARIAGSAVPPQSGQGSLATVRRTAEFSNASRLWRASGTISRSPGTGLPGHVTGDHADPTLEYLHGGLARVLVLCEARALPHADERLA